MIPENVTENFHRKHLPDLSILLAKRKSRRNKNLTAWDRVQIARSSDRPSAAEYIDAIFDDFMEFHGDRGVRDDNAIIGGIATLDGQPVTVIGIRKGHTTKENIRCNFGMPSPEGYKKALRLMKQAEKFGRAVIAFVDTPGHSVDWKQKNGDRAKPLQGIFWKCPI